jgi:transcriptional regulator with XRE-family HTH domain
MSGPEFVVARRKQLGLSQRDLAGLIKRTDGDGSISPQLMNCIEHGRRTYRPYVRDLAKALEVHDTVLWFFIGEIPERYRVITEKVNLARIQSAYLAFLMELQGATE